MSWPYIVLVVALGLAVALLGLYVLSRRLEHREPYASFLHLSMRHKVQFFRMLLSDRRVPLLVKVLPFLLVGYLAFPIDIIPDFIPVLGYVDDVAVILGTLAMVIRLTPRTVIDDLLRQLAAPDVN